MLHGPEESGEGGDSLNCTEGEVNNMGGAMEMILKEHGRGFVLKHEYRYGCHYGYGYKWTPDVANLPRLLKARTSEASCINKLGLEEQLVQGVDKLQLDEEVDVEHGGRLEEEGSWSQSTGWIASRNRLYLSTSRLSSETCV
jgi:hypothetical protein